MSAHSRKPTPRLPVLVVSDIDGRNRKVPLSILTTTSGASGILSLLQSNLITPLARASIAARVSTPLHTVAGRVEVPVMTDDPTAGWYSEGAEIFADDPEFETITVYPSKVAGITGISNESIVSGTGDIATRALDALVRDVATKIDAAYFGSLAAPAPSGLGSLAGVNALSTNMSNLDVFEQARLAAAGLGEIVSGFIASPATLLKVATLKESTGSIRPLVQPSVVAGASDVTPEVVSLAVAGTRLYASSAVADDVIWGVPSRASILVLSGDPDLATSGDAGFSRDMTFVRVTQRVGFAFVRPAAIQKITVTE